MRTDVGPCRLVVQWRMTLRAALCRAPPGVAGAALLHGAASPLTRRAFTRAHMLLPHAPPAEAPCCNPVQNWRTYSEVSAGSCTRHSM